MPLFLVAMPFVTSSDALAPSSDALCYLLLGMPLLLVAMPFVTSSDVLAPSSDALAPSSDALCC